MFKNGDFVKRKPTNIGGAFTHILLACGVNPADMFIITEIDGRDIYIKTLDNKDLGPWCSNYFFKADRLKKSHLPEWW